MDSATSDKVSAALAKLKELVPEDLLSPIVAIVCGSGLSTLGSAIKDSVHVPYADLPGFLTSEGTCYFTCSFNRSYPDPGSGAVEGHQSLLIFGRIGTKPVVAMLGRVSFIPEATRFIPNENNSFMCTKATHWHKSPFQSACSQGWGVEISYVSDINKNTYK